MTRQIYNTKERIVDDRKRRVTDLKQYARVTLARPLDTKNEALIEMRRGMNERIYNDYRKEVCNKKGEIKGNLTEKEKEGLRSLQKRMREQELVIVQTDKSGKMCVNKANQTPYERRHVSHCGRLQHQSNRDN